MIEEWVNSQTECPSRKDVQKQFPEIHQKYVKAAIQSRLDREKRIPGVTA
jgi:hypothetical protein